jgi:hypothetical protein
MNIPVALANEKDRNETSVEGALGEEVGSRLTSQPSYGWGREDWGFEDTKNGDPSRSGRTRIAHRPLILETDTCLEATVDQELGTRAK